MKIARSRRHRFNMAQYESLEIEAVVEFEIDDNSGDEEITEACAQADMIVTELLAADIERADETSTTPIENTYLHDWKDQT